MKDNRFIELLNLYIDRQITAGETAELEAEMQASPRRRAIYRQYCQMHTATKQVYDRFRGNSGDQPAAQVAGGVIANFENRQRSRRGAWVNYVGGLAAAACLTLVLVRFNSNANSAADAQIVTAAKQAPALETAAVPVMVVAPAREAIAPRASLISLRNSEAAEADYSAMLTALRQEDQRAFASGQMPARLPSLFDDGVFESRAFQPANSQRVFRGKQAPATQAEFTAFQFQR